LRRDLHGADVVLCVFDGRPASAAHQQVFLEHRRVGSAQRIHDVGFGDRVELSWAAITISKHALFYGDSGAAANRTGRSRWGPSTKRSRDPGSRPTRPGPGSVDEAGTKQ